ncbi:MAG: GDP-mannose 4,6-dehydratase [Candidatus Andersenbacteria bacterium]
MPSAVITGGNGFVGQYLAAELTAQWGDGAVSIWDMQPVAQIEGLPYVSIDITDPNTYISALQSQQPDWVIHLAAIASVPYAQEHPDQTKRVNVEGTQRLLETVRKVSPHTRVLVVSSADIYGIGSPGPIVELPLEEAKPRNAYASSKWEAEQVIEQSFNDISIRVRPFPHIGPGQKRGFVTADFASQIVDIEKGKQAPRIQVGNLESIRDFTDVRDVVRAYRLIMEKGAIGEVYHVASGVGTKVQDILDQLLRLSTVPITVEADPARLRPSDTPVIIGDATKLHQQTGWQTTISLEESLRDVLDWWREAN